MNFRMFPFDHQLCPLMLESYSYSNDQVVFQWDENYATPIEYSDKIEVNDLEQGPKFTRSNCIVEYSTGNYSCLRVGSKIKNFLKMRISNLVSSKNLLSGYFVLERRIGYYLIWAFFPSGMCVLISMAGFWIKLTASPARNRSVDFESTIFYIMHAIWPTCDMITDIIWNIIESA